MKTKAINISIGTVIIILWASYFYAQHSIDAGYDELYRNLDAARTALQPDAYRPLPLGYQNDEAYSFAQSQINEQHSKADNALMFGSFFVLPITIAFAIWLFVCLIAKAIQKTAPQRKAAADAIVKSANSLTSPSLVSKGPISKADEIRKWTELHEAGMVSTEEFERARKELIG